jgi:hypothetical protein
MEVDIDRSQSKSNPKMQKWYILTGNIDIHFPARPAYFFSTLDQPADCV